MKTKLITISELSRRAGVSVPAASLWVKKQQEAGIPLIVSLGRNNEKLIDPHNPLIKRYIRNAADKPQPRTRKGTPAVDEAPPPEAVRKLRNHLEKLEIQNALLRGKYLPRQGVIVVFDKILELDSRFFKDFSNNIIAEIEKETGARLKPDKKRTAKQLIDEALTVSHETINRAVTELKEKAVLKA